MLSSSRADPRTTSSSTDTALLVAVDGVEHGLDPEWVNEAASAWSIASNARTQVAFEGQLYNRRDLEKLHESRDAYPSDADLVLEAYERTGERFLDELEGVFALVLVDRASSALIAARDPLGISPLFFWEGAGETIVFSTSLQSLAGHPTVRAPLNRAVLADHLLHRWPDPEETFLEGIRRIPPGHALRIQAGRRELSRYWSPVPADGDAEWIEEDELDRFEELLDRAVDRALDLGPAGIYLSGGLDSVSVAAVATDLSRGRGLDDPVALSLVFPDLSCNEEEIQRGVAQGLAIPQTLASFDDAVGSRGLLLAALDLCAEWPAPMLNMWNPAYHHLSEQGRSRGTRVILTGSGGDEWLTVTPLLAADLIRKLDVAGFYRLWRALSRSNQTTRLIMLRSLLWRFGFQPLLNGARGKVLRSLAPQVVEKGRRRRLQDATPAWLVPDPDLRRALGERVDRHVTRRARRGFYLREGQLSLDHTLVSMELEEVFESGRRTGVPVRMPFWDARVVDFLYRTPPDLLNRGGRSKGLVRELLVRRFPALGFEHHRKVVATSFYRSVLVREGRRAWETMGGAPALAELGIVDPRPLNSTIEGVLNGKSWEYAYRIWDVLSLEAWARSRL